MSPVGFAFTLFAGVTIGALLVAIGRSKHDAAIADALTPTCGHCRDTGAHVTAEIRPRLLFCNMCPLGQMLETQAKARVDWSRATASHFDGPAGPAA